MKKTIYLVAVLAIMAISSVAVNAIGCDECGITAFELGTEHFYACKAGGGSDAFCKQAAHTTRCTFGLSWCSNCAWVNEECLIN
jgi:hypothetical protein